MRTQSMLAWPWPWPSHTRGHGHALCTSTAHRAAHMHTCMHARVCAQRWVRRRRHARHLPTAPAQRSAPTLSRSSTCRKPCDCFWPLSSRNAWPAPHHTTPHRVMHCLVARGRWKNGGGIGTRPAPHVATQRAEPAHESFSQLALTFGIAHAVKARMAIEDGESIRRALVPLRRRAVLGEEGACVAQLAQHGTHLICMATQRTTHACRSEAGKACKYVSGLAICRLPGRCRRCCCCCRLGSVGRKNPKTAWQQRLP